MQGQKRVFVFGAGFSKAAGMPLATELLPLLMKKLDIDEMREWLDSVHKRLAWLSDDGAGNTSKLNIEQLFHYARFDIEVNRLRQHLVPVGRGDGPATPWRQAESIEVWLSYLEDDLVEVIFEEGNQCSLDPIVRWSKNIAPSDSVLTFNYDTLVELALEEAGCQWNHGTSKDRQAGIPVYKLHGSIDWIVADRRESFNNCDLLFEKENVNRSVNDGDDELLPDDDRSAHVEDECRLWRCPRDRLKAWIDDRDLQWIPDGGVCRTVGIAGLGAYKALHRIPGLGEVWARAMQALYQADLAVVAGFSLSDFDAMAQLHFAEVARARTAKDRPLRVVVIDPSLDEAGKTRFCRVFRHVEFIEKKHENVDWSSLGRP